MAPRVHAPRVRASRVRASPVPIPAVPNSAANRREVVAWSRANGDLSMNLSFAGGFLLFSTLPETVQYQCQRLKQRLYATYHDEGMSEPTALGAAVLTRTSNRRLFDELVESV